MQIDSNIAFVIFLVFLKTYTLTRQALYITYKIMSDLHFKQDMIKESQSSSSYQIFQTGAEWERKFVQSKGCLLSSAIS